MCASALRYGAFRNARAKTRLLLLAGRALSDEKFGADGVGDVQPLCGQPETAIVCLDQLDLAQTIELIGKIGSRIATGVGGIFIKAYPPREAQHQHHQLTTALLGRERLDILRWQMTRLDRALPF